MFSNLTALGLGVITFAIVIGVGVVVLDKFGTAMASCPTGFTYNSNATSVCCNNSAITCTGTANSTSPSATTTNVNYMNTQLGTTGLAGWAPAIIALAIGLLFLGAFMMRKGRKY